MVRKHRKWLFIGVAIALTVSAAYYLVSRAKEEPDTSEREAMIAEAKAAREKSLAAIPKWLSLEEAKREYEQIVQRQAERQKEGAREVQQLRGKFDADPSNGEVARKLVRYLRILGKSEEAKRVADQWTAAAPEDATAWAKLAFCCWDLGLTDEGDAAIDKLEAVQGRESPYAHTERAYRAQDAFDAFTSMAQAKKAVELATTDEEKSEALMCLAQTHLSRNSQLILTDEERWEDYRAAYEAAKESLKHEDTLTGHLLAYNAAKVYAGLLGAHPDWRRQDEDRRPPPGEAYEHLKTARERWSLFEETWTVSALDRMSRGDKYGAWSAAKLAHRLLPGAPYQLGLFAIAAESAEIEPEATEARKLLANVLDGTAPGEWGSLSDKLLRRLIGRTSECEYHVPVRAPKVAVVLYPLARRRLPGYSRAMFDLGVALRQAGRPKEALEAAQLSLMHQGMMQTMGVLMLYHAALAAQSAGDLELADEYVAQAKGYPDFDASVHNDLAWDVALFGGDYDWAMKQLNIAVQADPSNLGFLDTKAYLLYKQGDFAEARKLCNQLIESGTGGFAIGYLGLMHAKEGDREEALQCLRKVEKPPGATDAQIPRELLKMREKLEAEVSVSQS